MRNVVKSKVKEMYYEARITAVVHYYALVKKEKINRSQACGIRLTEAQYMEVRNFPFSMFCFLHVVFFIDTYMGSCAMI